MTLTTSVLTALGVKAEDTNRHLAALNELLPRYGIDRPLRVSHFLAQVVHESARLVRVEENLNYSAEGLRKTFSRWLDRKFQSFSLWRHP
jgi:putative chitinase